MRRKFDFRKLIKKVPRNGQLLIEILLTIGLSTLLLPILFVSLMGSRDGRVREQQQGQAVALLKETEEAVKGIKKAGWLNLPASGTYYPAVSGSNWTLISGASTSGGFTKQVVISQVRRATASGEIATDGYIDPSTKKFDITISWTQPAASSITSSLYLTRNNNQAYTQTTQAQFNAGTKTNSVVVATNPSGTPDDGQVQLGAGGGSLSDWCAPNLSITPLDLPKSGVANALTAIEGRAFAGTGNNSSGVSFANINITNAHPPATSILGTFDGYKTNGVFGEANYGYLATDNNTKEVVIINVSSPPYSEAGYFNIPGNGNASSVFVAGDIGYATESNKLYTFDLSSKSGSRSQLGSLTLDGTASKVYVVGNYAYVAIGSTSNQLEIVQISNGGSTLTKVKSFSVAGQSAKDVFVNSSRTRAYLATASSGTQKEFFIIDVSPTSPTYGQVKGSYETNGMNPNGVTVVTNNKAIIVGSGGEEYQVINIVDETSPTRCGGLNIDSGINGVSSVLEADGDAYSYIITGDASSEFKIIEGGAGGAFSSSGIFESATYDAGSQIAFNRFVVNAASPSAASIKMQVAVAPPNGSACTGVTFNFLGPNGTDDLNDTFNFSNGTITGLIPLKDLTPTKNYKNPGQCFRYKVFLFTSDSTQTPILNDIIWNYSL